MKAAKYAAGDIVRVKTLDELQSEFGEYINTPCGFVEDMYKFCGQCMEVMIVCTTDSSGEETFYYILKDGESWHFDECVLEDELSSDLSTILMSYESLFEN